MKKSAAIARVAAVLALNSAEHIRAAKALPTLRENTAQALERNREACAALGFEAEYAAFLSQA